MKLTFKKLALLGLSIVAMFVLVGCTDTTTTTTTSGSDTTSGLTDTQKVQAVLDGISLGNISAVSANITLPTASVNGVTLTWSSEDVDIINTMGEVTIPTFTEGNATITLTLTATLNSVTLTKEFDVTVLAETADQFLTRIGNSILITGSDSLIASFTLPSTLQGVTITWTSSNTAFASIAAQPDTAGLYKVTITRPIIEDGGVNTSVTLTATLVLGTEQKIITKEIRVLAMNEVFYMTVAEAASQADDTDVMFKGIVTAVIGGSAFVQDATGGIYLYNVGSSNAAKLVVGNELEIVGKIDIFGGFIEVAGFSKVEVLSTGNALPEAIDFDLVDIDALTDAQGNIANMTQLKLKALVPTMTVGTSVYFALTDGTTDVNIKVDKFVDDTLEAQIHTLLASLTLNDTFKLVNMPIAIYEGVAQFYISHPSQLVVLNDAEKLAADKTMLTIPLNSFSDGEITLPLNGIGGSVISWAVTPTTATINATTGVVTFPTLTVDTDFTFTATITKGTLTAETKEFVVTAKAMTAADKVAADKAELTVVLTAKEYDEVTLPVLGSKGSIITWAVVGDATWTSPKLTYNFNDGVEYNVTLTATITSGDVNDTKEFTVVVSPIVFTDIEDMYGTSVAIGDLVVLKGRLTGATTNSAYWIQDATGGLNVYVPSAMRTAFAGIPVGSEVILFGKKQIFNGLYEVEQLTKYIVLETTPELPAFTSIDEVAFNTTDLLAFQGQLVSFAGFTVKTLPATVDANGTYQFILEDIATGREIVVRLDYRVPNYTATKDQILTFVLNQKVDVQGAILNWYNTYQLSIFNASHIVNHVASPAEIAADDAAALTIDATYDANEVVTLPSTSNTSTIVWSVELAEVNASITNNVVTFANVTETTMVTLTATLTYGTGEGAIVTVKEFEVSVIVLTPAQKLAADKEALTVSLTATEFATITLPTTTTFGSVVTWALTETVNASLTTNELTLNYAGVEYNVVVTATLTLAGEPALVDTKEFTIVVSPVVIVTEFSTFNEKTGAEWTFAGTDMMYIKGIVSAKNGTSGFFLQDASGDGLYAHGSHTVNVGDEVIIYTKLVEYSSVRQLNTWSVKKVISTGNTVVVTTMTYAELGAIVPTFYEYAGRLVSVSGIEIKEFRGNYLDMIWTTVAGETPVVYMLSFNYNNATYSWLKDVYEVGDFLPAFNFALYNIYSTTTFNILPQSGLAMTDVQAVGVNVDLLPASLELIESYTIPTAVYGSSIVISAVSEALQPYLTTGGIVTLPEADVTGTITFLVVKNMSTQEVTIPVTVKALPDTAKVAYVEDELLAEYNNITVEHETTMDLLLTDSKYGATITWASNNAVINATTGVVGTVTSPTAVVLTATVTLNAVVVDVTINVVVAVYAETIIYSTGFETAEGFTVSTTYNNQTVAYFGPALAQWGTYFGTASTTGFITGAASMQMRYYTTTPTMYGYTFTNFVLENATYLTFNAKNNLSTNGASVKVSYSTDGGTTWIGEEVIALTNTSAAKTYTISTTGLDVMVRFEMVLNQTGADRLTIDDVVVYGMTPVLGE